MDLTLSLRVQLKSSGSTRGHHIKADTWVLRVPDNCHPPEFFIPTLFVTAYTNYLCPSTAPQISFSIYISLWLASHYYSLMELRKSSEVRAFCVEEGCEELEARNNSDYAEHC